MTAKSVEGWGREQWQELPRVPWNATWITEEVQEHIWELHLQRWAPGGDQLEKGSSRSAEIAKAWLWGCRWGSRQVGETFLSDCWNDSFIFFKWLDALLGVSVVKFSETIRSWGLWHTDWVDHSRIHDKPKFLGGSERYEGGIFGRSKSPGCVLGLYLPVSLSLLHTHS